jgi:hypothetical protein
MRQIALGTNSFHLSLVESHISGKTTEIWGTGTCC